MGKAETEIQNSIRMGVSDIAIIFRINTGMFCNKQGTPIKTGTPNGFSDLFGVRRSDGKAIFIEVKTSKGVKSKNQENFIEQMRSSGACSGFARSIEEARKIILDT
jgi:hypothetical protein